MQYDFTTLTDRRNTNSMKWSGPESIVPAWVADMDFPTAPAITQAVVDKAQKGIFGYTCVPDRMWTLVADWWKRRYGWTIVPKWMHFTTGVMPSIHSIVKSLTAPGDKVVVLSPVYHCFFHAIEWNGRFVKEARSRLKTTAIVSTRRLSKKPSPTRPSPSFSSATRTIRRGSSGRRKNSRKWVGLPRNIRCPSSPTKSTAT